MVFLFMLNIKAILKFFEMPFILSFLTLLMLLGLIPVLEFFLLYQFAQIWGIYLALSLTIASSLVGFVLVFLFIRNLVFQLKVEIKNGVFPEKAFSGLIALFFSSLLLAIPGFFTNLLSFLLFVPIFRYPAGKLLVRFLKLPLKEIYEYIKLYD